MGVKRATQSVKIWRHVQDHGHIDNDTAIKVYAVYRLSERIREINRQIEPLGMSLRNINKAGQLGLYKLITL